MGRHWAIPIAKRARALSGGRAAEAAKIAHGALRQCALRLTRHSAACVVARHCEAREGVSRSGTKQSRAEDEELDCFAFGSQ